MAKGWDRVRWVMALSLALVTLKVGWAAEEEKGPVAAPAVAAPDAAAPAPVVPPYFAGTIADPQKPAWPDPTGGAAGVWATPGGDGTEKNLGDVPSKLTNTDLYDRIAHNLFSINMVWTLIAGFLVMFMQAGFAMVETGLCRAKNAAHTIAMNFMVYPLGCIAFWAYGFALGWGNWFNGPVPPGWYSALGPGTSILNSGIGIGPAVDAAGAATGAFTYGLLGTKGFFLNGLDDVSVMCLFFFMMVFMDTTATIPTGAMAERWGWKNFCLFGLWVALPYCIYANWVWGGGCWRKAGSTGAWATGRSTSPGRAWCMPWAESSAWRARLSSAPRMGKYRDGKPRAACRGTTCRWWSSARSSWRSAGSASIPARPWRGRICGSAWSS